jgi:hypothetical protein
MADDIDLDAETLRQKASAFRQLAAELLGGDFRKRLLDLALDYDLRAARLERTSRHCEGLGTPDGAT